MNSAKVSVIIPIYNVEEYLEECLDSVVKQTLDSLQVIMVDDGSTDSSSEIAKKFARKYDYFEYIYQDNAGLGNARNTGVKYANGDYLIFLDSDDIVPSYAYEKMYCAAERNQSDMAIGNVIRFNSKREMTSGIHKIAFLKIAVKTHITENVDLIYDTTAWNKLIRRDFWEKHEFQFPEKMLYEDIPVTIPMHYLANHVSVVYDICYRWRVRDGANKSITQKVDDDTNFNDRLKALRSVDHFFAEHVTDEKLIYAKHYKWLNLDLMIFINTVIFLNDEIIDRRAKGIKSYLDEVIPASVIDDLPAIAREKYQSLLDGDYKHLIQVREYETSGYRSAKIKKRGKKYFTKFPKELIRGDAYEVTTTLARRHLLQSMYRITNDNDQRYTIEGYAFIPGFSVSWKKSQTLKAYLYKLETGEKIPLQTENRYAFKPTRSFGLRVNNEYGHFNFINYTGAGYRITIHLEDDIIANQLVGEYKVLLEYERGCWKHQVFLSGTEKAVKNKKVSSILKNTKIDLDILKRQVLQISVGEMQYFIKKSEIRDNCLRITSNKIASEYCFKYDNGSLQKIDAAVKDDSIEIPCESIPDERVELGILRSETFIPLCWQSKFRKVHYLDDIQLLEQSLRNYHYRLKTRPSASNVDKATQDGAVITVEISKTYNLPDGVEECYLFYEDPLLDERTIITHGTVVYQDGKLMSKFHIDLNNHEITKNLYAMKRKIFICYSGKNELIDLIFGMDTRISFNFSAKNRKHKIFFNGQDELVLETILLKGYFDRSAKKRSLCVRFIYPLFRKLPLKKKTVVLESMWGTQFSCNPKGLYEYIDKEHPEYTCVWVLKDECTPITGNGIRVRRLSLSYFYYLARSHYFVNNVNFDGNFIKRKNQIEVQTMHGTPLKTMGLEIPGEFPTRKGKENYIRRCKRWDYLIVQSDFVADITKKAFLFDKEFMFSGYPRTDVLFEKNNEPDVKALKEKFGLPADKKVIMYAPTWRIRNKFELMLDIDQFKEKLSEEYVMIFRVHHLSAKGWKGLPADDFFYDFSHYRSIEEFYLLTDILITDYSSVMFDFAVLNRPMLFFTYDLDTYRNKLRGFYVDFEKEAPGELVFNSDEVLNAIVNIDTAMEKNSERIEAFKQKYNQYEGPNSSKKVFEQMTGRK